ALRLLADWAFSALDLAVVLLEIHETNLASAAVAEAAGFRHSGRVDVETAAGPRFALLYVRLASDAVTDPGPGGCANRRRNSHRRQRPRRAAPRSASRAAAGPGRRCDRSASRCPRSRPGGGSGRRRPRTRPPLPRPCAWASAAARSAG